MRSTSKLTLLAVAVLVQMILPGQLAAQTATRLVGYTSAWKLNQSGTNLGAAWREPAFDDSTWQSGFGIFSIDPAENFLGRGPIQTILRRFINGVSAPQVLTYYFRTSFNFTNDALGVTVVASNLIDDGAVFYLNGQDIGRFAMPSSVSHNTLATRADEISGHGVEVLNIPLNVLQQGLNVLAVELHQGFTGSTDAAFGMDLWTLTPPAGPVSIARQPGSRTNVVGTTVTMQAEVTGGLPVQVQWYKDGLAIAGAVEKILSFPSVQFSNSGSYHFTASNLGGSASVTSSNAILSVISPPFFALRFGDDWRYDNRGVDLGTAWREPAFDDSTWPHGPGPLGFEAAPLPIPLATSFPNSNSVTYYFRTTFIAPQRVRARLRFTNEIDDGAVFFLNGTEIFRTGMPEGPITHHTAAARSVGDASLEEIILPEALFISGTNHLAVELHQLNTTSSDMVFGTSTTADFLPFLPLSITNEPADVVIAELQPFSLTVGVTHAGGAGYQWFKDNVPLTGPQSASYSVTQAVPPDAGIYHVTASNELGIVTSRFARVTVTSDDVAPFISNAEGNFGGSNITVRFSESVAPESATNLLNYVVTNLSGGTLQIISALRLNSNTVLLTTSLRSRGHNYLINASQVQDLSFSGNLSSATRFVSVSSLVRLVEFGSSWRFFNPSPGSPDPAPAPGWQELDYDERNWLNGKSGFAFPDGMFLPVPQGTALAEGGVTAFFRHSFYYDGYPSEALWSLIGVVDDGAIMYLNGAEILRFNLAATNVTATNYALIANNNALIGSTLALPGLVVGSNLFAVEVHACRADADRAFALRVETRVSSYPTGPVVFTHSPEDQTVTEQRPVTFKVAAPSAHSFQWFQDHAPISGATNVEYTVDRTPLSLSGARFHAVASNDQYSLASTSALLTVATDTTPPTLLSAWGRFNTVTLNVSEALTPASAAALANFTVTSQLGIRYTVLSAVQVAPGTVVVTTGQTLATGDVVRVYRLQDLATIPNQIVAGTRAMIGFDPVVLPFAAVWLFDQSGIDRGTAWREIDYDTTTWSQGPGTLGYETAVLPEPINTPILPQSVNGHRTTYFRAAFSLPSNYSGPAVEMTYLLDDSAVFYVNGSEIQRVRMPAGAVDFYTYPTLSVGDAVLEGPVSVSTNLVPGMNTLAVELHQGGDNSSDIVLGVRLTMQGFPSVLLSPAPEPELWIEWNGGVPQVWWNAPGFVLQETSTPPSGWTTVPNASSPFSVPTGAGNRFYRLTTP